MTVATKRATYTPPAVYTKRQLEELWITAGGKQADAPTAAAVALAESGGKPNEEGHNTNGSIDRGLWQINSVHGSLSTTNVLANAKAAVQIHSESGWSPWVTYKTGAYRQFTGTPITPQELLAKGNKTFEENTNQGFLPGEHNSVTGWVGELLGGLGKAAFKGLLLVVGAAIFAYGVIVAFRKDGGSGIGKAAIAGLA